MFILCPQCQFLVAMEPATGLPPARCPRCGHALQVEPPATPDVAVAAPTAVAMEREVEADRLADAPVAPVLDADALGEAFAHGASAGTGVELESAPTTTGAASAPLRRPAGSEDDASRDASDALESEPPTDDDTAPREPEVTAPAPASPSPRPRRSAAPSFVHPPAGGDKHGTRRGPIAVLAGLTLLLVLQLVLADRARLAADARWRPAVATVCDVLRCSLPAWHEPEAFTLVARDVRPMRPGVLHVSASFRNDARWAQAWPALHLALQDVDGRTVGARVFAPREYLGRDVTQNDLAPGQVASVAFDVGEPPGTVVAFTFDFR